MGTHNSGVILAYIDSLIEGGTNFRVERKAGAASFSPAGGSDADLEAFQSVVHELRAHEGDGYDIHIEHPMSDRGRYFVDLVLITLHRH